MRAIKKINNNFALCLDSNGVEMIVYGRGVGFGKFPCEITLDKVERTFYDVNAKYVNLVAELPQSIILASADIAEKAAMELKCELNPNLPFSLADHLNFAIERSNKGIVINTPLAYDIKHLYPREIELGYQALDILKDQIGVSLPDSEAVSIAMHLINAEAEGGDMHSMMMQLQIISDVDLIVEQQLGITIDKNSYQYSRFMMHLRYLIQRLANGKAVQEQDSSMLKKLAREHPDIYACANQVVDYFLDTWHWKCNKGETLYLMLHIYRIKEKTE